MKVCFIGIGSIARRHIRNLQIVCGRRGIPLRIDAFRHKRSEIAIPGISTVYYDYDCLPCDYDVIFITNPTEYHLDALRQFHRNGKHFFIEKPLVSVHQLEEAETFPRKENAVYYVACPLRYHAVIQYIKQNIDRDRVISVRSISSSYLPEWRPGQDYRASYSAHKNLGGGVSIDLIHEWDYLSYLFGSPFSVFSYLGKKSDLEIDSEDYALYIADCGDLMIELHLDYFGRKTIREIQLFMKEDTIVGDIANNRIHFLVKEEEIVFPEQRDDYQQRELDHFLNMVYGIEPQEDEYTHGIQVLRLTQGWV